MKSSADATTSAKSPPTVADFLPVALATAGAGLVWYLVLMREVWTAAALSPICGHAGLLVAHCAPCYAALSLMAGGLAAAGPGMARAAAR